VINEYENKKGNPGALLETIVEIGFKATPPLRDEIYFQLWKQTRHNPQEEQAIRIWVIN